MILHWKWGQPTNPSGPLQSALDLQGMWTHPHAESCPLCSTDPEALPARGLPKPYLARHGRSTLPGFPIYFIPSMRQSASHTDLVFPSSCFIPTQVYLFPTHPQLLPESLGAGYLLQKHPTAREWGCLLVQMMSVSFPGHWAGWKEGQRLWRWGKCLTHTIDCFWASLSTSAFMNRILSTLIFFS